MVTAIAAAFRASMEPAGQGYIDIDRNSPDDIILGEAELIAAMLREAGWVMSRPPRGGVEKTWEG